MRVADVWIARVALALCDGAVFIPLWGKGASLNVHVALGIVVYQIRAQGLVEGETSDSESGHG